LRIGERKDRLMDTGFEYISSNIDSLKKRIQATAEKSGREFDDITLIAVTKTVEVERIKTAIKQGIFNFGENRVQELLEKYDIINVKSNWHLIGHLQTNKVKYIVDKVSMIHSVDRLELAKEIQKHAERFNRIIDVLIQVNISGEDSKFGIKPDRAFDLIKDISLFENIKVKGLMTIAPNTENKEEIRNVFKGLKEIFIDIKKENIDNVSMEYLSMGMSGDFEIAIEEGANMIRVGSAIFGKRL
jgi:pyridoxal phosphate enzyme (YggS family)